MEPQLTVGETIAQRRTLGPDEIATFARLAGDHNPVHHDPRAAAASRFGSIIASGPQTSSLLMGLVATHFSRTTAMLGIEFRFRFRGPVLANQDYEYGWEVVATRPHRRGGVIAFLAGGVRDAKGVAAVKAVGKVLVQAEA